jgi:toxin ParE1/3/4
MAHRIAPQAEADLDDTWLYVAMQSGSIEIANRLIDSITDRFHRLARFPFVGRARDRELAAGLRTFPVGDYVVVYSLEDSDVAILRVVHGHRDLERLFRQ